MVCQPSQSILFKQSCTLTPRRAPFTPLTNVARRARWHSSRRGPSPAPAAQTSGINLTDPLFPVGTTYTAANDVRSRPPVVPRQARDPLQVMLQGQAQAAAIANTLIKTKLVGSAESEAVGPNGTCVNAVMPLHIARESVS